MGTGVPTDVLRLASVLMDAAGAKTPVQHAPERPGEQRTSYLDVSKAGEELGWRPAITLEEGLSKSFEWFRARRQGTAGAVAGPA